MAEKLKRLTVKDEECEENIKRGRTTCRGCVWHIECYHYVLKMGHPEFYDRLSAYEDLGLSPEEIRERLRL